MTESTESTSITDTLKDLIGQRLVKALFEEITNLRMPWSITPQQQQQEVLDRLQEHVENAVSAAVSGIASAGFTYAPARIDSLAIKDEAKATILLARGTEAMHVFADRVGSAVVVVFADPKDYTEQMAVIMATPDQPRLPLE